MATVYTNAFGTLCFTMMKESVPVSALSACGLLNARGPVMAAVVQSVFSAIAAWKNGAAAVYDLCVGAHRGHGGSGDCITIRLTFRQLWEVGANNKAQDRVLKIVIHAVAGIDAGLTEAQARDKGFDAVASEFQFRERGKAQTMGELPGVFKLVADKESGRLLGAHFAGACHGPHCRMSADAYKAALSPLSLSSEKIPDGRQKV